MLMAGAGSPTALVATGSSTCGADGIGMIGTIGMALTLDGFTLQPERNARHAITIGSSVR